jgi:ankyrin repeat protein
LEQHESADIFGSRTPGLLIAALVLGTGAAMADENRGFVELAHPKLLLPSDDPERLAHAALARGDRRLIWTEGFTLEYAPIAVYCSAPTYATGSEPFVLGHLVVSDGYGGSPASAFAFAARYNRAIVNDPEYPFRDICRAEISSDDRPLLGLNPYYELLPIPRLYENVRPEEMPDGTGLWSLQHAARLGRADRIRELVRLGLDVDSADDFGMTALAWAVARDHQTIIDLLLESAASLWPLVPAEDSARTRLRQLNHPLFIAAVHGRMATKAKLLAAHRAQLAGRPLDKAQQSVLDDSLMAAARQGNLAMAKLLVQSGAQVSVSTSRFSRSTLALAMMQDRLDIVDYLLSVAPSDPKGTALHTAVAVGRVAMIDHLLERGADPNVRNSARQSPLLALGCSSDPFRAGTVSAAVARRLRAAGADLDLRDEHGMTALLCTLTNNWADGLSSYDFDLAVTLIELGADVNVIANKRAALDNARAIPASIYRKDRERLLAALADAGAVTAAEITAKGSDDQVR